MSKIRCLIVEDEVPAAEELKYLISQHEDFVVEAIACNGEEGERKIKEFSPDVVFLDINMPLLNGVELAKKIQEEEPATVIVFMTAYCEHAIKAFELNVLDYVLKPVDESRLEKTLDRIQVKFCDEKEIRDIPEVLAKLMEKFVKKQGPYKKLPGEINDKIVLIDLKDIFYCYIEGEKTYIKTFNENYLTGDPLNSLEKKTNFFRAHRSFLVNLDNVKELYAWFNGAYKIVMNDSAMSEIPISRNNVKKLKEIIGL
ncbi:MAG: LytR/AlgR family response regulator transcription factor [Clostridiaceae bacterium]